MRGVNILRNIIITIAFVFFGIHNSFAYDFASIPANTWVSLNPTGGPLPVGIDSYSGMAISKSGKLIVFGGGHNDYLRNDTWIYDMTANNWSLAYTPDPDPTTLDASYFPTQYPGSINYSGVLRPLARHTYSNIEMAYDLNGNEMMLVTGKYGPACCSPDLPYEVSIDHWSFTPNNNQWNYLGSHPTGGEGSSIFVPHGTINGGKVYHITKSNSYPAINAYDVTTGQWNSVSTTGMAAGIPQSETSATYDSREHAIYLFSGLTPQGAFTNGLWRLDLATLTWQNMNPGGSTPPAGYGQGITYDSINHVLIIASVDVNSSNTPVGTYIYDIANNQWNFANANNTPNVRGGSVVYSRLRYDATRNVAFLVVRGGSYAVDTYAYRYQNGGPITRPTVPTNLSGNATSESEVNLSWNSSTDDNGVGSYRIYRAQGASAANATYVGTSSQTASDPQTFSDTGLSPSTQYTYKVTAVNNFGYESDGGATLTLTTLADVTSPTILTVNANGNPNSVSITFSEAIDPVSGNNAANYNISGGVTVNSADTAGSRVTLNTSTLSEGITYTLTVNNVGDQASPPNLISSNTSVNFNHVASLQVTPPPGVNYTWGTMGNGTSVFVDRSYSYSSVQSKFATHPILQTANDHKQANLSFSFNSNMNLTVFLGHYLDGIDNLPSWIKDDGWVQTTDTWPTSDRTLYVYAKDFSAGVINLYENGAASSDSAMYTVLVVPQGSVAYTIKQSNGGNPNPIPGPGPGQPNNKNTISTGAGSMDILLLLGLLLSLRLVRKRQSISF